MDSNTKAELKKLAAMILLGALILLIVILERW